VSVGLGAGGGGGRGVAARWSPSLEGGVLWWWVPSVAGQSGVLSQGRRRRGRPTRRGGEP
jgi:hypothetical protein